MAEGVRRRRPHRHGAVHLQQEMAEARVPRPGGIAIGFAGPTLIVHGTEEQKQKYLPDILEGETVWCQGYSRARRRLRPRLPPDPRRPRRRRLRHQRPEDLDLRRAPRELDVLLARTDPDAPKHRGISYFIVDMKSPGITVRPLDQHGRTRTTSTRSSSKTSASRRQNIIGEENRGWYVAQTTLDFERSSIGGAVGARQTVEDLIKFAKRTRAPTRAPSATTSAVAHGTHRPLVEAYVATMMSFKIVSIQAKEGVAPGHEASVAKIYRHRTQPAHLSHGDEDARHVRPDGREVRGPPVPLNGRIKYMYLRSIANTIEGGSSEIQRNIIATRGLGLPRA